MFHVKQAQIRPWSRLSRSSSVCGRARSERPQRRPGTASHGVSALLVEAEQSPARGEDHRQRSEAVGRSSRTARMVATSKAPAAAGSAANSSNLAVLTSPVSPVSRNASRRNTDFRSLDSTIVSLRVGGRGERERDGRRPPPEPTSTIVRAEPAWAAASIGSISSRSMASSLSGATRNPVRFILRVPLARGARNRPRLRAAVDRIQTSARPRGRAGPGRPCAPQLLAARADRCR